MDLNYVVDKLVISFMKIRFLNEKSDMTTNCDNEDVNNQLDNNRLENIDNIIHKLNEADDILEKSQKNEYFNEIEKMVYSNKWNNLKQFHKLVKIKEYLDTINMLVTEKDKIFKILEQLLTDKKLKHDKHIVYNSNNQRVTSISILKIDENGKYYIDI